MAVTRKLVFDSRLLPDGHLFCPKELIDKKNLHFKVVVSFEIENDPEASEQDIKYTNLNDVSSDALSEERLEYYHNLEPRQPARQTSKGELMAQYLEKIANSGGISEIPDPVEWQREIRKERNIYPGD